MPPGSFIRVLFPTREAPQRPGLLHIGYVLASTANEAMLACTTSQPWPARTPPPAGARFFDTAEAALLSQSRAFIMRLDIVAKLPLTSIWFPDINQPGHGVIAVAPPQLQEELTAIATNLIRRRRELIQMRGV